ncbi:MAG: chorismate synthase [Lachnospiraceae bacterium]
MSGSTFGRYFTVTTWGESHGAALGAVIDGCPAGLPLTEEDLQRQLDRRRPGQNSFTTSRREVDSVSILSGVFKGRTTGTPISVMVRNTDQRSHDYSEIASYYRPGHADYTFDQKYGFRDYRGGGRSSGRETIGRVAAGAIALKILQMLGITVRTYTQSIGPVQCHELDYEQIYKNDFFMPDKQAAEQTREFLLGCMKENDSSGGVIACHVQGLPAGLGDPVFEKLDANLAKAVMSIGAVKAIEIGDGVETAKRTGSQNNDSFYYENGTLGKRSNHAGGILGGISDGSELILRASIKPTASIAALQQTVNKKQENIDVSIKGRHDPVIVPRAVVVVESMTALCLVDALFANMSAKISSLCSFYNPES